MPPLGTVSLRIVGTAVSPSSVPPAMLADDWISLIEGRNFPKDTDSGGDFSPLLSHKPWNKTTPLTV